MTDLLRGVGALEAERAAWHALWRADPRATPFQSPEWGLAFAHHFAPHDVRTAAIRDGHDLAGLLPSFAVETQAGPKRLPLGAGLADYCDALLSPAAPPGAATRLLHTLLAAADAPVCDFADCPPGAHLLAATPPAHWCAQDRPGAPCPVLPVPPGAATLRELVPPAAHRKFRMNTHRAERAGGFAVHRAAVAELEPALATLFRLHAAGWAARGVPGGVLADPRVGAFLREVAGGFAPLGLLRLATATVGGTQAAACLAFAHRDRLYLYMSGFDPAFATCSPGSLLLGTLLDGAIAEGCREIHFLRGDESYKHRWGATDRHNTARHFVRDTGARGVSERGTRAT